MTLAKKIMLACAMALSGKQALATVGTVAAAGVTAAQIGSDPWPWVIGAMGSTVVYANKRGATRAHSLSNGVICIFMGGIGAPYAGSILQNYVNPIFANELFLAGVLSVSWPWVIPFLWDEVRPFAWKRAKTIWAAAAGGKGGPDA